MKGYIYTMYAGADPALGWQMTDPIFGKVPTLGACVNNIRRAVVPGDFVFVVSGRVQGVQQYVVGGFEVSEKIDALAAYRRFPEYRMRALEDGSVVGNIIVNGDGSKSPLDCHSNFESRVENYIVGGKPVHLKAPQEVAIGRRQTVPVLSKIFHRSGTTPFDIIGRWRRLDSDQIEMVLSWLRKIKKGSL